MMPADGEARLISAMTASRLVAARVLSSPAKSRVGGSGLLPQPIVINRRNFYRASEIAAMQENLACDSVNSKLT